MTFPIPTRQASMMCPSGHVFDARRLSTIPNIETVPIWARFRCSVSIHHLPTRRASKKCPDEHVFDARGVHYFPIPQTSKPCPSGHGFDARRVSTTSLPAKHRQNAQMGTFSMLGVSTTSPSPDDVPTVLLDGKNTQSDRREVNRTVLSG